MSADTTLLEVRMKSGFTDIIEVMEIIAINGKPYVDSEFAEGKLDAVIDVQNHVIGRVDVLENLVNSLISGTPPGTQ